MTEIAQPPVTAYLAVNGARDAIDFYRRAFGAELLTHKMAVDRKRVVHAALGVFGTMIMLSDEFPEYAAEIKSPRSLGSTTISLHVGFDQPADVDAALNKAKAAGCMVTMPAADTFWGMRYGRVTDPFGHAWAFGAPLPANTQGSPS
jgi:PhnB protein